MTGRQRHRQKHRKRLTAAGAVLCIAAVLVPVIPAAAAGNAVKTAEMFFQCKGEFLFLNKGRPNAQDCAGAAEFARKQVKLLGVT